MKKPAKGSSGKALIREGLLALAAGVHDVVGRVADRHPHRKLQATYQALHEVGNALIVAAERGEEINIFVTTQSTLHDYSTNDHEFGEPPF